MHFSPVETEILRAEKAHWGIIFLPFLPLKAMRFGEIGTVLVFVVSVLQDARPLLTSAALLGEAG